MHSVHMESTSEQLDYIPASIRVIQHVRYKYGCKACEGTLASKEPHLVELEIFVQG